MLSTAAAVLPGTDGWPPPDLRHSIALHYWLLNGWDAKRARQLLLACNVCRMCHGAVRCASLIIKGPMHCCELLL